MDGSILLFSWPNLCPLLFPPAALNALHGVFFSDPSKQQPTNLSVLSAIDLYLLVSSHPLGFKKFSPFACLLPINIYLIKKKEGLREEEEEEEKGLMDGPGIPPYFLCPISLQVMKDPVTISTGVSYDRSSIERWLSAYGHSTCPVTNQPLDDRTLTPNATLLRLIQSWAADANESSELSAAMAPKPAFSVSDVLVELSDAMIHPDSQIKALKKIRTLAQDDAGNIAFMEKAGVTSLVASLIARYELPDLETLNLNEISSSVDEAMSVLRLLEPSPEILKKVSERKDGELITSLSSLLHGGSYRARIHATLLLRSIFKVVDHASKSGLPPSLFEGIVEILKDQNSSRATTRASLSILMEVLPHGRNRGKVVEAGGVPVMVELLVEEREDRRKCEVMLYLLELVCGRAEGRAALVAHPAGVAAVVGKVLKVSSVATEKAVKVLGLVCRHCGVVEEMMEVGGVGKLCMVVQVVGNRKSRNMAREILGMHLKEWSKFACFSSSYLL